MRKIFQKARVELEKISSQYPNFKKIACVLIITLAVLILLFFLNRNHHSHNKNYKVVECDRTKYATVPISPQRRITDKNDVQNLHAKANGLSKIYTTNEALKEDLDSLLSERALVQISDNKLYRIKKLTHSFPYVTMETANLLNRIAVEFQAKLKAKKMNYYQFYITSALRTLQTQKALQGRNGNASSQSAHLYGTTVDITYKEFYNEKTKKREQNYLVSEALRETMLDLREQCRLVVIRERKQACYHFTVVNCDPQKIGKYTK